MSDADFTCEFDASYSDGSTQRCTAPSRYMLETSEPDRGIFNARQVLACGRHMKTLLDYLFSSSEFYGGITVYRHKTPAEERRAATTEAS